MRIEDDEMARDVVGGAAVVVGVAVVGEVNADPAEPRDEVEAEIWPLFAPTAGEAAREPLGVMAGLAPPKPNLGTGEAIGRGDGAMIFVGLSHVSKKSDPPFCALPLPSLPSRVLPTGEARPLMEPGVLAPLPGGERKASAPVTPSVVTIPGP